MNSNDINAENETAVPSSETISIANLDDLASVRGFSQNNFQSISSNISNDFNRDDQSNLSSNLETLDLEEQKNKEELSRILQLKQIGRKIAIPTNDSKVRLILQELKHPEAYPGESPMERRDRLINVISYMIVRDKKIPDIRKFQEEKAIQETAKPKENEVFFTEGSLELKNIRMEIAKYSLPRAAHRIEVAKKKFMEIDRIQEGIDYERYLKDIKNFEFVSSQFVDDRGVTRGAISPDEKYYGISGVSGLCTILKIDDLESVTTLKGHTEKVNSLSFHPQFLKDIPMMGPNIATCSNDSNIKLWSFNPELKYQKSVTFKGHEESVNQVEFHPMGTLIGSASNDRTWRLWDIEKKTEVLLQEGHAASVTSLSFQNDGALLATADSHGIGLVWDLRSGRNIFTLQGHVMSIATIKFSSNCYQIATGSDDNTLKIWDLRKKSCAYTIPAHNQAVSDIHWEETDSKFLLTCSFDGTFKLWNNRDWSVVKCYDAGETKLSSISITKDCNNILLACSNDRTVKKWTNKKSFSEENSQMIVD